MNPQVNKMTKYCNSHLSQGYPLSSCKDATLMLMMAALVTTTLLALIGLTTLRADAQITSLQAQGTDNTGSSPSIVQDVPSTYQTELSSPTVKITSPQKNQQVPVGQLVIKGVSSDTMDTNCEVLVILNGIKPYQPVSPSGSNGTSGSSRSPADYSTWTYNLSPEYTLIKEGENKITSKIACQPGEEEPAFSSNLKHYSVNVTGFDNDAVSSSLSPQNPPVNANAANRNDSNMLDNTTTIFVVPIPSDLLPQLSNPDSDGLEGDNNSEEDDDSNEGDGGDVESNGKEQGRAKGHGKNKG